MKFLFDECLSPALVQEANRLGYEATCARDLGALGESDRRILARASQTDRVVVTNNDGDYTALCQEAGAHPGLILLPSVNRADELALLAAAVAHIEREAAVRGLAPRDLMFNRVIEVSKNGTVEDHELPAG